MWCVASFLYENSEILFVEHIISGIFDVLLTSLRIRLMAKMCMSRKSTLPSQQTNVTMFVGMHYVTTVKQSRRRSQFGVKKKIVLSSSQIEKKKRLRSPGCCYPTEEVSLASMVDHVNSSHICHFRDKEYDSRSKVDLSLQLWLENEIEINSILFLFSNHIKQNATYCFANNHSNIPKSQVPKTRRVQWEDNKRNCPAPPPQWKSPIPKSSPS